MRPIASVLACVLCVLGATAAASAGERIDSVYTHHAYATCPVTEETETGKVHHCDGLAGIPVIYDADEHSALLGFGAKDEIAATDWLVLHHAEAADTIEWRGPQTPQGLAPVAAIARLSVSANHSISGPRHDVLVVYRLDGPRACVVAVVPAATGNANRTAREIADRRARRFRCGIDQPNGPA